ncbi:MAG: fluoride efflux transporter CrcB [Halobacteria archaeon]|nr:fluoride efflux transporter CrcB [Halobacteria archaeon]
MPVDPAYLVGTGGAVGAVLRHIVGEYVEKQVGGEGKAGFPFGTLTVNVVGSLVLGFVTFWGADVGTGSVTLLVGTGACGSFTTFSSFSFETFRLYETGATTRSAVNAFGNLALCLTAVAVGYLTALFLGV